VTQQEFNRKSDSGNLPDGPIGVEATLGCQEQDQSEMKLDFLENENLTVAPTVVDPIHCQEESDSGKLPAIEPAAIVETEPMATEQDKTKFTFQTRAEDPTVCISGRPQDQLATGTTNESLSILLLDQATLRAPGLAMKSNETPVNLVRATFTAMESIDPQDAIEGMLATQLLATNLAMKNLTEANAATSTILEERVVNRRAPSISRRAMHKFLKKEKKMTDEHSANREFLNHCPDAPPKGVEPTPDCQEKNELERNPEPQSGTLVETPRMRREADPPQLKFDMGPNGHVGVQGSPEDFQATLGTSNPDLAMLLMDQATFSAPGCSSDSPKEKIARMKATCAALQAIGPADAMEGMLAVQLVTCHQLAMKYLTTAARSTDAITMDAYLNRATKLFRTHTQLGQALRLHRRKSDQNVRVEHVHVNAGVQAIVGAVDNSRSKKVNP